MRKLVRSGSLKGILVAHRGNQNARSLSGILVAHSVDESVGSLEGASLSSIKVIKMLDL